MSCVIIIICIYNRSFLKFKRLNHLCKLMINKLANYNSVPKPNAKFKSIYFFHITTYINHYEKPQVFSSTVTSLFVSNSLQKYHRATMQQRTTELRLNSLKPHMQNYAGNQRLLPSYFTHTQIVQCCQTLIPSWSSITYR